MSADTTTVGDCTRHCAHGSLIKRDSWGRPAAAGQSWTRVSTLSKTLDDGFNLGLWKARVAVSGICQPQAAHLRERVVSSGAEEAVLKEVTTEALVLGGEKAAATRGSSLHDCISLLNRGQELPDGLSEDTQASVKAYREMMRSLGLRPVLSEQFVVAPRWDAAGTFDAVYRTRSGEFLLGDVKTSAGNHGKGWESSYPLSLSLQLSAYAHGRRWCPVHSFLPAPEVSTSVGLLISVPFGGADCKVYEIDLSKAARLLDWAVRIREARKNQSQLNLGERKPQS